MAYFAKVRQGKVVTVIVAEQEFIDNMVDTSPGTWIETCKKTRENVHKDGGTPLRYNFAQVGGNYNKDDDAFYAPQPYPSWTLNTSNYIWEIQLKHQLVGFTYGMKKRLLGMQLNKLNK